MLKRRSFLQSALVATLLCSESPVPAESILQPFPQQLQDALGKALADPKLAAKLAPILLDVGFTWEAPVRPATDFRTIIAYSFGNRPPLPGAPGPAPRPEPGPINQQLAAAVVEAQRRSHATVIYAQWEIASFLQLHEGNAEVVPINPVIAADKSVKYLSTDGVAEAAVTHAGGDAAKLGRVCVIGHHDHAKRCVETSRARKMDAWAMEGLALPLNYDTESDQPWTRDRETYLIHDMAAQLFKIRAERIAAQAKAG